MVAGLIALLSFVAFAALVVCGLALHWSRTPHGRLKPVFAFGLKINALLQPGQVGNELGTKDLGTPESRERARAKFLKDTGRLAKPIPFAGRIEDRTLPGPAGDIPVRIYTPPGAGPHPAVVYVHGGGFVIGSVDYTDGVTRSIATRTPAVVISVEYRLAPEHPYPAALDDVVAVVDWAAKNAEAIGARPGPVTIAGDSAGGNLAAFASIRDRDAGRGHIALQVLIYPGVDPTNTDRASYELFATGYGLTKEAVEDCMQLYVPTDEQKRAAAPLLVESLEGLPPAFVITAGFDVLRDEGIEYVKRLEKAGVQVHHTHVPNVPHGYITANRLCREASESIDAIVAEVRAVAGARC